MQSRVKAARKVIALGGASFAVILPKEWVVHQQIGKGSEVILFPQQNGSIIVRKSRATKTRVVLDARTLGEELLDAAIQSSFLLNVDETVTRFSEEGLLIDKMNHLWEISQKFNGMNLAISGPYEITMTCLVNTGFLKINEIFDQLLSTCGLLLAQTGQKEMDKVNRNTITQVEEKYHLGVRLLTFALHHQNLGVQAGVRDIIQVLGYRVALLAMRSIILQLYNIRPYLKPAEIPDLAIILEIFHKLTHEAIQCLHDPDNASINQIAAFQVEIKALVDKIGDRARTARNFFQNYLEIIDTFKELAVTRHVETLETPCEE